MGLRPWNRGPPFEKSFKYRLKSITQRSLTEIDPSRKSAPARKKLFRKEILARGASYENVTSAANPKFAPQIAASPIANFGFKAALES